MATLNPYTPNPNLDQMASNITDQVNQNWSRNINPQISSGAMATGGYGGSRQGVVQANALKDINQGLSNSLTDMYSQDYNNQSNRNLQQYGMDQGYELGKGNLALGNKQADNSYSLGLGNLALGAGNLGLGYQNSNNSYDLGLRSNDLGYANLDANIAQNNFGNQMQGANFGLDVYNTLMNGNSLGLSSANSMQNTPMNYFNNFNSNANGIANGYASDTKQLPGDPLTGALGGALMGNKLYNSF